MNRISLWLLLLSVLIGSSSVRLVKAQDFDSLVLNVTVTTEKGAVARGLTLDNFSVIVDKQPQKILSLSDNDIPASIGILLDDSGSQYIGKSKTAQEVNEQFREGLKQFFRLSNPENEYFVTTFNREVKLVQDWTSDPQAVVDKLDLLTFKKQTSVHDAMKLALEKVKTGRNSKRVLLLISDGDDNNSTASFKEVRDLLKASDVTLYCVGISNVLVLEPGTSTLTEGFDKMNELSEATGGRGLFMTNASGPQVYKEVFELIALELRSQYRIVIAADQSSVKRRWRTLKVVASRVNAAGRSERFVARTRKVYYG